MPTTRELFQKKPAITPHALKVYDDSMKFILLAIFVLFAAQPLQASSCDMCDDQETGHSQHSTMHDGSMEHENMQDMDCCDHDPGTPDNGCSSMSHCGACVAGLGVVSSSTPGTSFNSNPHQPLPTTEGILSRSGSPPFRPPIA